MQISAREVLIPVCPEQLGGLSTPRECIKIVGQGGAEVLDGDAIVISESGKDVTKNLVKGAIEVLKIAKLLKVQNGIMKAESPSCGSNDTWKGVTVALLKRNGIHITTEKEYL